MSIIIVYEINKLTTVRFSFYLSVTPTTKESTGNPARKQRGATAFLSMLRLISWSLTSGWKEETRLPAQSPHSKEFLAPAAHEHSERYGCGVAYTCMPDHTEEQLVLAHLEPGQNFLFCEDLQEIEQYMLQQAF